jgi:zinc transporter ZupT
LAASGQPLPTGIQPIRAAEQLDSTAQRASLLESGRGNIGLGFALVSLAAAFSMIGASLPFVDYIVPRRAFNGRFKDFNIATSKPFLASSLGFSAGLLLALPLGDLIPSAMGNLVDSELFDPRCAQFVVTALFVLGFTAVSIVKAVSRRITASRRGFNGSDSNFTKKSSKNDVSSTFLEYRRI